MPVIVQHFVVSDALKSELLCGCGVARETYIDTQVEFGSFPQTFSIKMLYGHAIQRDMNSKYNIHKYVIFSQKHNAAFNYLYLLTAQNVAVVVVAVVAVVQFHRPMRRYRCSSRHACPPSTHLSD